MRGVQSLRRILRGAAALPPATELVSPSIYLSGIPQVDQILAGAGILKRISCRHFSSEASREAAPSPEAARSTHCDPSIDPTRSRSAFIDSPSNGGAYQEEGSVAPGHVLLQLPQSEDMIAGDMADGEEPPLVLLDWWKPPIPEWVYRRAPGLHSVWQHKDLEHEGCMSALDYMKKHHPIESVCLFGETWPTEVTTKVGTTLICGFPELFEEMRSKGWSFFYPLTPDMLVVDECGKVHIADGTILRLGTQFSRSLDIIFGADCLESLLFSWSPVPLRAPSEVIDFLNLMRSPQLQPEYLMFIHPAGVLEHLRGPLYMRLFDFVIHGDGQELQVGMFAYMNRRASGWGYGAQENMLMRDYFFYKSNNYMSNEPRDGMYFRRTGECHILGFQKKYTRYGFEYTREEQQLLLHAKCGMFSSLVQTYLWDVRTENKARSWLKALKMEEFFCRIGYCCPIGECMRVKCFDREAKYRCDGNGPEIRAVVRSANMIRTGTFDEYIITQRNGWYDWNNNSYCKPHVQPEFGLVSRDYYPHFSAVDELTVKAGDVVQLLYEPKHHVSEMRLGKRYCYVRDAMNNVGFVHVKFLKKYSFLLPRGQREFR